MTSRMSAPFLPARVEGGTSINSTPKSCNRRVASRNRDQSQYARRNTTFPRSSRRSIAGCRSNVEGLIPVFVTRFSKSMNRAMRRSLSLTMLSSILRSATREQQPLVDGAEDCRREEQTHVPDVGQMDDLALRRGKYARDDDVVGAGDDRREPHRRRGCARRVQPADEGRIRTHLATDPGEQPVGVIGTAVGRAEQDAAIDAARAAEKLEPGARDQTTQAVTDQIDAAAANALPQRDAQLDGCALDPLRRGVAEREQRADAEHLQEKGQRVERRAIPQIAVDEDDGALVRPSRRPLLAGVDPEGIEQRRRGESEQLPADEPRCRSG